MKIVLGSSSPRRQQFIKQLGYDFEIIVPRNEEKRNPNELPRDYVVRNSEEKSDDILAQLGDRKEIVVTGDTVVAFGDDVLEKPKSVEEAISMLERHSGNKHTVFSGVCVTESGSGKRKSFYVKTEVQFKNLSRTEIEQYVATKEPMDKAGAYALQGIGAYMVKEISGSYSNVIGLPLCELWECLTKEFEVYPYER